MSNKDDKKVEDLLRKIGEIPVEYPPELLDPTRDKFLRQVASRTCGGTLAVLLFVAAVVYIVGKIYGWW